MRQAGNREKDKRGVEEGNKRHGKAKGRTKWRQQK